MTTFGFYKSLMEMIDFPVTDDGTRTVYIQNISPSEARDLRETLRKMGSVKNYLPLLNKVFIEFESAADADQIGVWYSLQTRCPAHNVSRIKVPQTNVTSSTPHLVATAAPESKDVVAGPIVPPINTSIPEGSWAPFSVAMTTAPFLFPTVSPWFIIPKFRTVDGEEDLLASVSVASKFSTVMLTGLPEGSYKHEDVAKLVWKYFTKQNLQTLFYNIVVLPLQKRAFVYFNDWRSCNNFVQDFLKKGVSFTSHQLHIHLVLEEMNPGYSEDMMYQTLMKWSNAHVPELDSLAERLVCVALSETSLNLIMATIKLVTSISPVVSFLPLANRLCIEMAESRGVDQVVERFACAPEDWNSQVQSVGSVKSLKLRLRDSGETEIDLERNTEDINDKTPATKNEPQPPSSDTPVKTKPPVQEATHLPNNAPSTEQLPAKESGTKIEIGATENENVQSKVSEKQSDVCGKVQESAVVPRNKTETEKKKQQAKTVEAKEDKSENAAKSKVGKTEDEKSSPAKPTKTLISTPMAKTQPSTPLSKPHKSPQTSLQTSVKAPSQLQKCINPKPTSSAENPKTKTNISGNSAAVKNPASKVSAASAEIVPNTKYSTAATKSELLAATTSTEAFPLTPGEKLHHFLTPFKLCQLDINTILSPMIFSLSITLVVSNLPRWFDGSYTETEIINILQKCRVQCDENEIFIVPQSQMAFLIMPRAAEVQHLFRVTPWRELFFKGRKLGFHVVTSSAPMTLFRFYRYLMSFTDFSTFQMKLGTKNVLYFPNISASEARDLREALRKISSCINYLPLLNRVFVHCETLEDADRLEAWYSYWRWSRSHNVQQTALSASAHALQIWENISVETSVPQTAGAIPEGTNAPFWMTMTKSPYVVHTASPFFKVPAFRTVNRNTCARISERDLKFAAIMLTGLPNRSYTHEEVAMLVWRHFPEQNLHTLYNNVVVLPLQRRAFVIFSSSCACIGFLRDRNKKRVYFKGFIPNIHLLLEDLSLGSSEESMFRSLMKWSNIHVPDLTSLGERLLVVEASGTNEHITMMVMKEVASIATFASFLPLANRIYIEMAESIGVRKVVEKLSVRKLCQQHEAWNLVGRVESLLSRKERLKDCEKIALNLELGTMSVKPEATPLKTMDKRSATCSPLPDRSLTTSHKGTGFLQVSSGSDSSFKSPSSSKPTTKEMKISHSSSATRDIPKSNKDCKSSASSTGSTKSSLMSSAMSLSVKTQKDTPEYMKSQTNQYSSAGGSKSFPSSSSKTFKSLGSVNEKDQQSKREAPLRAPQTSSASSSQSTSSPATSAETPQLDKHGAVLTPAAVAKANHKVSAEGGTAKHQLSPKVATSNLNQGCFKAETLKEGTESKEKQKKMDNNTRNHVKQGNDPLDSKHIATKGPLVAIKEEKPLGKDEDSKVKLDQSMKTSSGEEGYTLPIKQESSDKKYETKIKESSSETGEKTVCKDSVPDESPIHTFVKKTDRGANQDETNQDKSATVVRTISQSGKDVYAEQKEIRKDGLGVSAQEEKPFVKDEGLAVKLDKKTRVSESEDGQNSAKEQSLDKQPETRSKIISAETGKKIREMICEDSLQDKSGTKRSARLANPEQTKEDNAATNKPTIPTRLTITEKDSLDGRKDNTPRKRNTTARVSQQQNEEKSEERSVKNTPPSTCEQKLRDILDIVDFNAYSSTSGQRTHSSLATAKALAETNQLEKKEANPTEDTVVKSECKVTTERKSAKMDSGLVVDTSEKKLASKAETPNYTTNKDLWVSDTVGNEVQTCSQSAAVNKQEHLVKDEGLAVKSSQRTKASKSEDGVNSSKKQESSLNQTESQSKDISAEMQTEEMVYKDSVQHKSGLRRCFRRTTRLANQDKTNENKAARGGKLTESDSLVERKEDKTPTRRRRTPARDPQQQNEEKTLKVSSKNVPSITCNSRETQEEEKEAATPRRRGRPKKKVRPVPEKTHEVSPKNVLSMTCNSRETQEEEKEAAAPRRRGRPKKKVRPVPEKTLEVSPKNVTPKTCNSRETQEEEKEAATPRRRGRPKKKVRPVPEKTLEVSPKNIPSMTCNSRETQEEEKEAATPRRGRPKKKVRPVPVRTPATEVKLNPDVKTLERLQHKRKMDLSGPEPKRFCSQFAPVAAGVRCPPHQPQRPL
ncbi:uncharacterized protein LOC111610775 [Xiphophorus maculatus]|uniref:uncharacterized protein LOC111610775 n=1 Tax=Xiphophorus maculatus TaxID=8083 RepID=UPI000C6CA85F|nr:uncharacterized protein LOC111610775 [Xiphophorus maculatus]